MMAVAEQSLLVVTHDKLGKTSLAPFAAPEEFQAILTDSSADPEIVARFRNRGLDVILC
jgi:DeoR/GlpR family transcriptional regulator of sugar metabolism